ncbi:hypothetical protein C2S52_000025 [Perilla frutescens var. hirtella]|nr:hypothetical protein C2S51_000062 [Perilla frutescens var. frutescens]KAH6799800.1 hypothetical protein C2S52_000025 [Perilla frutescens var. hirtella]
MSVNFSGTPYTFSFGNRLTTIGCDDAVLQYNGSAVDSGCSAFCGEKNDTGGVGYCQDNVISTGSGCCQGRSIARDILYLGVELMDLSRKLGRRKFFPCSYAFIQERVNENETTFSYPLYYLDNSTALENDNWASTSRSPVVRLDWKVGAENCSRAKLNLKTYACRDEKTISLTSSIAKYGCPDQCGKLSIPYPFGVGPNCYLEPSFEVICDTSTNPPIAYLNVFSEEIVELNSSQVLVNYPNQAFACYSFSNSQSGIIKTEERSLIIDLSRTQYTFSSHNWINAIGCDDMVVGIIRHANRSFIGTSCAAVCRDRLINLGTSGFCPVGTTDYSPGNGCCRAAIPRGATYLEANLSELSGRWPRTNFSCSYAFLEYKDPAHSQYFLSYPILNNSTEISFDVMSPMLRREKVLVLDWRIGVQNCNEARRNPATFACKSNSDCVDFDATVGGYLCNCSNGYQGNPYLPDGCQDIDECADDTTNPCQYESSCFNTPGSFKCSCPKEYFGDGKKYGSGCIPEPKSRTKMIILIGMGSGLGFLLLLLMCFWLHKVLQKRKQKMLKDKFFKRNGGLLLQQQTNEGALGKTKVFLANELEVATDHFNSSRILGQGGQGTVYKGMLSDGKIVAIKKSKVVEENQLEQFINEVVILSQINHRNVVKLLGCCLETEVPLLVYEFMSNGTLFDLIHDPNNEFPFPWNMRLKIAADIAGALAYLHSASSMPIYHRDIKSSNILLDEKYVVKVSDFGTSRSVAADQTHLTTMVKGTFGYLDPEYFQSSQFTEKSDVYSFGVVLVELLTGQRPISLDKTEDERSLATRFLTSMEGNFLDTILDSQVSKGEVILVARLAQRCLNLKGKMRPTMKEVATELENFRMSSQMSTSGVKDESKDASHFEGIPAVISDNEYRWTDSYKSLTASSDTDPLIFTT